MFFILILSLKLLWHNNHQTIFALFEELELSTKRGLKALT